jgi:hypothetical protein
VEEALEDLNLTGILVLHSTRNETLVSADSETYEYSSQGRLRASCADSGRISLDSGVGAFTASAGLRGIRFHLTAWARALCKTWWIFWTVEPESLLD